MGRKLDTERGEGALRDCTSVKKQQRNLHWIKTKFLQNDTVDMFVGVWPVPKILGGFDPHGPIAKEQQDQHDKPLRQQ